MDPSPSVEANPIKNFQRVRALVLVRACDTHVPSTAQRRARSCTSWGTRRVARPMGPSTLRRIRRPRRVARSPPPTPGAGRRTPMAAAPSRREGTRRSLRGSSLTRGGRRARGRRGGRSARTSTTRARDTPSTKTPADARRRNCVGSKGSAGVDRASPWAPSGAARSDDGERPPEARTQRSRPIARAAPFATAAFAATTAWFSLYRLAVGAQKNFDAGERSDENRQRRAGEKKS